MTGISIKSVSACIDSDQGAGVGDSAVWHIDGREKRERERKRTRKNTLQNGRYLTDRLLRQNTVKSRVRGFHPRRRVGQGGRVKGLLREKITQSGLSPQRQRAISRGWYCRLTEDEVPGSLCEDMKLTYEFRKIMKKSLPCMHTCMHVCVCM